MGQGLGCAAAYLIAQLAALAIPLLLNPLVGDVPGLNQLISAAMTGCTCLGSLGLAFGVSMLVVKKFPPLIRRMRSQRQQPGKPG